MNSRGKLGFRLAVFCIFALGAQARVARAQSAAQAGAPGGASNLDDKIEKLTQSLEETRAELAESRSEIRDLRTMLQQALRQESAAAVPPSSASASASAAPGTADSSSAKPPQAAAAIAVAQNSPAPAQISQDDWQILNTRVDELQQDKVESASKYRLKISGLVLATAFANTGQVDNLDVPTVALPRTPDQPSGSAGGSLRQSIVGLTAVGPHVFGASTAAELQMDFFGGEAGGYGGATAGVARLRIARVGLAWKDTSVIAGLDTPLFSPEMPTTYLSVAIPAFGASGNLWTWTPQIRVEHSLDTSASIWRVQAGLMDSPSYGSNGAASRFPSPGESSRQPTYAVRFSANGHDEHRPYSLGVSGIYFPQRYAEGYEVKGWGAVGDWKVPFLSRFTWTGEMFVGKGLDVFGGVPEIMVQGQDPYFNDFSAPALAGLTMFGGWTQLKFRLNDRSEINAAVGSGGRVAAGLREIAGLDPNLTQLSPRNDMFLVNYIFHVRSDFLISPEFRRLRTFQVAGAPAYADQAGIALGYLF